MSEALNNDPALVLVCCCGLLCTHLRDPVPHFRRQPSSDYGLERVRVSVSAGIAAATQSVAAVSGTGAFRMVFFRSLEQYLLVCVHKHIGSRVAHFGNFLCGLTCSRGKIILIRDNVIRLVGAPGWSP